MTTQRRGFSPRRLVGSVRTLMDNVADRGLPWTQKYRSKVKGDAGFDSDGGVVFDSSPTRVATAQSVNQDDPSSAPTFYPISAPQRDFVSGVRTLWIVMLILMILYFASFLTLLIWRCIVVSETTPNIIRVFLVTVFSIFNGNQFYPTIWPVSSYLIDIPLLIVFSVCFVTHLARFISLSMIGEAEVKRSPLYLVKQVTFSEAEQKSLGITPENSTVPMFDNTVPVSMFDASGYKNMSLRNFYVKGVYEGFYWFRWLDWLIAGGALLWVIMTVSPIQDIILLASLLLVYTGVIILGFLHEYTNRVKLTNVALTHPFGTTSGGDTASYGNQPKIIINRRAKQWYGFGVGVFLNIWIWVAIFLYYGYADNFNPSVYQWFRLTVAPIGVGFYLLIIPLIMIIWSMYPGQYYNEIGLIYRRDNADGGDTSGTAFNTEPVIDTALIQSLKDETSYYDLDEHLQQKVHDYMFIQDWNKNVNYEITMLIAAAICSLLIGWILWGGMMSQNL